jgi:hypothetical protein
VDV